MDEFAGMDKFVGDRRTAVSANGTLFHFGARSAMNNKVRVRTADTCVRRGTFPLVV
jgi:hypothetical protein